MEISCLESVSLGLHQYVCGVDFLQGLCFLSCLFQLLLSSKYCCRSWGTQSRQRRQGPPFSQRSVQCGGQREGAQGSAWKKKEKARQKQSEEAEPPIFIFVCRPKCMGFNSALRGSSGLTYFLDTKVQSPSSIFYPLTQFAQFRNTLQYLPRYPIL